MHLASNSMRATSIALTLLVILAAGPAAAQWTDGQDAEYVVGKPDFVTFTATTTQDGMADAASVALDVNNGKMYVSDYGNHRVLRYGYPLKGDAPKADLVFGQSDYASAKANTGGTASASTLNEPCGLLVDSNGRLWVADYGNHRVLWFNSAHSIASNQPGADGVLGQVDFTSGTANLGKSVGANTMNHPCGLAMDAGGNLFVADAGNNRVLRFDLAASKKNGADADGVLGQADFTTAAAATTQSGMDRPVDCAMDATALFVVEVNNSRVLRFDSAASTKNGANADGVLGQADYTSSTKDTTQANFYNPWGVTCDGEGRLYVCDCGSARVVIFNKAAGKSNGDKADNVLGQEVFTTRKQATTRDGMYQPSQAAIDNVNGKCLVAEFNNDRVLVFDASAETLPVELSGFRAE